MHETILAERILRAALDQRDRQGGAPLKRLFVRIGELESISREALRAAFDEQARGTAAKGAELVLESIPATLVCEACGNAEPMRDARDASACRRCGNASLRLDGRGWTVAIGGPTS